MSTSHDPEDLLASISDGAPTDWAAAEREAQAADRPRLALLHGLARIADYHRRLQHEPDAPSGLARWGELVLLERLGTGGRSEVWRAWDPALEREVALKLMREGLDDAALLEEGRCLARVRHPHVVSVLGADRREGRIGLWMELIHGGTVEQIVRAQGPLEPAEARRLGLEIGAAVAAVHAAGLVHRDIKPANVIRDAAGRFVLADFGLGLRDGSTAAGGSPSGTPMYMAPELLEGAPASERSDLYSLGMLVWFALAGRHPFAAQTMDELTTAARVGPARVRELRAGIPAPIAEAIEASIAPDPPRRTPNVRGFLAALEAAVPPPARAPRARVIPWLAAAALLVATAVVVRQTSQRPAPPNPAAPAPSRPTAYAVEATLLRRDGEQVVRLVSGDRVKPGQRLSLEVRVTRPAWVYVLDEDERGERFLLYPQPRLDVRNPLRADSTYLLPGTVDGGEHAWAVTSAGGREYVLVVVSPAPIPEIEADLDRLPRAEPGSPVGYAPVGNAAVEVLRGIGAMQPVPRTAASAPSRAFDKFRALAGRESDVRGAWIRQIVLENPAP